MRYNEMKNSDIPWIGEVPISWNTERSKNLFVRMNRPVDPDDEVITCFRDGQVTLRKNRRIDGFTESLKEIGYQGIRPGDLVIHQMDAFAGAIGVSDSKGKGTPVYICLQPKNNVFNEYYAYLLRTMAETGYIKALYRGIRERSSDFRFETLATQVLPVPPLAEQEAIAAYLDEKCAVIDEIIQQAKVTIEEYKEWKASVIFEAVTKGLDPDAEMKDSGVQWIGMIPKGWNVRKLKWMTSKITDGSHFSPETVDDGYAYITAKDVNGIGLKYQDAKKISSDAFEELQKTGCRPVAGDVLLVKDGATTGRVGLMIDNEPCVILSSVAILRPASSVKSRYLMYMAMSDVLQFQIRKTMAGSAMPRTTLSKLVDYEVVFCPPSEQSVIVDYLDNNCEKIDNIIDEKQKLIDELEAYKKSLIFETVTGKRGVC